MFCQDRQTCGVTSAAAAAPASPGLAGIYRTLWHQFHFFSRSEVHSAGLYRVEKPTGKRANPLDILVLALVCKFQFNIMLPKTGKELVPMQACSNMN